MLGQDTKAIKFEKQTWKRFAKPQEPQEIFSETVVGQLIADSCIQLQFFWPKVLLLLTHRVPRTCRSSTCPSTTS